MTDDETISKPEWNDLQRLSGFGHSFVFRHSCFVIIAVSDTCCSIHSLFARNQIGKLLKKVGGIVRSGRSLGMVLHAENRQLFVAHSFHGSIV
jgi:hypothetical protein